MFRVKTAQQATPITNNVPFRSPMQATIETRLKTAVSFSTGQTIECPTSSCPHVYVVLSGSIAIRQRGQTIVVHEAGDFVSGFDGWGIEAVAQSDSTLVAISQKQAWQLISHPPDFVVQIVQTMIGQLTRCPS